jgi:hypothetical protein
MKRMLVLAMAMAMALGGCYATTKRDYTAGWSTTSPYVEDNRSDGPFSARTEPAKATSLGNRELLHQGYIWIRRQPWLNDRDDRMPDPGECARDGARRGADLYRFAARTRESNERGTVTRTMVGLSDYKAPTRHEGGYVETSKEVDVDRVRLLERDVDFYRRDPEKAAKKLKALDAIAAVSGGDPTLEEILFGWGTSFEPAHLGKILRAYVTKLKVESIRALAKAGADLEWAPNDGRYSDSSSPALSLAAAAGRVDAVKVLLEAGGKATDGAIWRAAPTGNHELVRVLLSRRPPAERKAIASRVMTWPQFARDVDWFKVADSLLANGADPNFRENDRFALLEATQAGSLAAVRLLVEKGADVNLATKDGKTALSAAGNEIAAFLRSKGAK